MANHPTHIFLHNPKALRIEYLVDEARLILWWSPRAGASYEEQDRNFSNRDDHLDVFDKIVFSGLALTDFSCCEYDPYHTVVRYMHQRLHIATLIDQAAVLVWTEQPQQVDFKTYRCDEPVRQQTDAFQVRHAEPRDTFQFQALLGPGQGSFTHQFLRDPERSTHARCQLEPDQTLVIGVHLADDATSLPAMEKIARDRDQAMAYTEKNLAGQVQHGQWHVPDQLAMNALRDMTIRSLHSAIDDSGALRASLKDIYYLLWIRDSAFCYGYQAMAGWPHRLAEWCRLLLHNPLQITDEPGVPSGPVFGQLVSRRFGKLEEDGIYYAVWSAFTYWTQTGDATFASGEHLALLQDCMDRIETYIFDPEKGLFGGYFADESPMKDCRDCGWDLAVGKPVRRSWVTHGDQPVMRSYDIYINLLMHAAWSMLAAMSRGAKAEAYQDKADRLWHNLAPFFADLGDSLPPYGKLLLEDGTMALCEPYGPARSVYVWGLALPTFAPVRGMDGIRCRLLDDLLDQPGGHWINSICSVIAAVDPWVCPEQKMMGAIDLIVRQSWNSGCYLPMPGAMPEKCDAPQGNRFHDIRPQAFAQSSWLAACSGLGVRRLPYGLAVRATQVFARLDRYAWRNGDVSFVFNSTDRLAKLKINGVEVLHTLQLPQTLLKGRPHSEVVLEDGGMEPCLLRSSLHLNDVRVDNGRITYDAEAFGLSEAVFSNEPAGIAVQNAANAAIPFETWCADGMGFVSFTARGSVRVSIDQYVTIH